MLFSHLNGFSVVSVLPFMVTIVPITQEIVQVRRGQFFDKEFLLCFKKSQHSSIWPSCKQVHVPISEGSGHQPFSSTWISLCKKIGPLHELITWLTFGKHEYSSLLNNFSSTNWKGVLKLGKLWIFSHIPQKYWLQLLRKLAFVWEKELWPPSVEASNVINDPKCNKGPKRNNFWP